MNFKHLLFTSVLVLAAGFAGVKTWSYYHMPTLRAEVSDIYPGYLGFYLKEYDAHGVRNSAWDGAMHVLIKEVIYDWYSNQPTCRPRLLAQFHKLFSAQCNDPLYLWFSSKYWWDRTDGPREEENFSKAFLAMRDSGYSPALKFQLAVGAANELACRGDEEKKRLALKLRAQAFDYLLEAIADPAVPAQVIAAPAEGYFEWAEDNLSLAEVHRLDQRLEEAVNQYRQDQSLLIRTLGAARLTLAWCERGTGYANTVTPEGAAGFARNLEVARGLLERSWDLRPSSIAACHRMNVELGQGAGRETMELWFQRAMQLDPECKTACDIKLNYLRPRWYGSEAEVIKFGGECVENPSWRGRVPLVLVQAVVYYVQDQPESEQAKLWSDAAIWGQMRKSYQTYLKKHPEDLQVQHEYLTSAYKASAWDDFGRQVKSMGSVSSRYLSMETLNKMMGDYSAYLGSQP